LPELVRWTEGSGAIFVLARTTSRQTKSSSHTNGGIVPRTIILCQITLVRHFGVSRYEYYSILGSVCWRYEIAGAVARAAAGEASGLSEMLQAAFIFSSQLCENSIHLFLEKALIPSGRSRHRWPIQRGHASSDASNIATTS
jgi:hypothetical protein